jgi:hypothetical protein
MVVIIAVVTVILGATNMGLWNLFSKAADVSKDIENTTRTGIGAKIGQLGDAMTQNPGKTAIASGASAAAVAGAMAVNSPKSNSPQQTNPTQNSQPTQQPGATPQDNKTESQPNPQEVAKQFGGQVDKALTGGDDDDDAVKNVINTITGIITEAKVQSQKYNELQDAQLKISDAFNQKVNELVPAMVLNLAKSPFGQFTDTDLAQKIGDVMQYLPYQQIESYLPKVVQGYYLTKTHGVDTSQLSIQDLAVAADNPSLVQDIPQEVGQVLNSTAQTLALQAKSALGKLGVYKDMASQQMESMKTQALMLSEIGKLMNDEVSKRLQSAQVGIQASRVAVENAKTQQEIDINNGIKDEIKKYKLSQINVNDARAKNLANKTGLNLADLMTNMANGGNSPGITANSVQ